MKWSSFRWLALALILFAAGCNKDEDPKPTDFILGKWGITDVTVDVKVGTQTLVEYLVANFGMTTADAQLFANQFTNTIEIENSGEIEFKADGTYTAVADSDTSNGKWELTADGKTLTTDKGTIDEAVFTVVSHTSTKINLATEFTDDESGSPFTIKLSMELTRK
jgi:hypothetical protein